MRRHAVVDEVRRGRRRPLICSSSLEIPGRCDVVFTAGRPVRRCCMVDWLVWWLRKGSSWLQYSPYFSSADGGGLQKQLSLRLSYLKFAATGLVGKKRLGS